MARMIQPSKGAIRDELKKMEAAYNAEIARNLQLRFRFDKLKRSVLLALPSVALITFLIGFVAGGK